MPLTGTGNALFTALAALGLAAAVPAAEDYALWPHSADLFLNTTSAGAGVASPVARFPLLVRLDSSMFDFREARRDGRDVRFSDEEGRHLPYQVERWDSARAAAEIWVLVDTVRGGASDQYVRMHWGAPTAPDSSRPSIVFDTADGFLNVYHLGGPAGNRPNAVAGHLPAEPVGYEGNESAPGAVGLCDSLGGDDYLQMRDGFERISANFTFSAWAYPTAVASWARLLDLGNGAGADNLVVARKSGTDVLYFEAYVGGTPLTYVEAPAGSLALNQWQHFAVTLAGSTARIYRNGELVKQQTLSKPLTAVQRTRNYLGKSNWSADQTFQGKLDEIQISHTARSTDWLRLAWANQAPGRPFVTFQRNIGCRSSFRPPRDTAAPEGRSLELEARADCATSISWSVISGPAPHIADPQALVLQVPLPRVARDTAIVYRFVARYGDSVRSKDVRVTVREAVPEPEFALAAPSPWNGTDSLIVTPAIANLEALRASGDSVLAWSWTLGGLALDTSVREESLVLRRPEGYGTAQVGLCLQNGGPAVCREAMVTVAPPSPMPILTAPRTGRASPAADPARDARGRLLGGEAGSGGFPLRTYPARLAE